MDKKTIDLLSKWLDRPEITALVDEGNLKEVIRKTLDFPAITVPVIKDLIKLFLQEGYRLKDLIDIPKLDIPLVEVAEVQIENNSDGKTLSVRYAADLIDDPTLNIFLTLITNVKYIGTKLHIWVYAPDDSRIYPEVKLYCDSLFVTQNYLLKDITDDVSDDICTRYDSSYTDDGNILVYYLDGEEETARDIIDSQLFELIGNEWRDIFENNNYKKLGIEL